VNSAGPVPRSAALDREREPRLSVIIVNYESWPDVARLVAALTAEPEFRAGACQVVVVDNASHGPIPAELLIPRAGLQLEARRDNGGFAVGVNTGWRAARGPWLLILNPDVEIAGGFLGRVLARLARYQTDGDRPPGIVGFGLRNPDGSAQGSVGAFPSLARSIWEQFLPRSRRKYQPGWRIRPGPVDWATGACMLVNAAMIAELGGMDEDFFLYHEEVAFSLSARRAGWRVEYDPSVSVVHRHPLQNRAISPKMRVITRHSKLLYFLKHLPRWQFLVLSAIVTAEAALRGRLTQVLGRSEAARAWRTIGAIARRLRRGVPVRGRDVAAVAEWVAAGPTRPWTEPAAVTRPTDVASDPAATPRPARMRPGARRSGATLLQPRKDGPA
jgi:GT2 family glycosyltransferase